MLKNISDASENIPDDLDANKLYSIIIIHFCGQDCFLNLNDNLDIGTGAVE